MKDRLAGALVVARVPKSSCMQVSCEATPRSPLGVTHRGCLMPSYHRGNIGFSRGPLTARNKHIAFCWRPIVCYPKDEQTQMLFAFSKAALAGSWREIDFYWVGHALIEPVGFVSAGSGLSREPCCFRVVSNLGHKPVVGLPKEADDPWAEFHVSCCFL